MRQEADRDLSGVQQDVGRGLEVLPLLCRPAARGQAGQTGEGFEDHTHGQRKDRLTRQALDARRALPAEGEGTGGGLEGKSKRF